MEILIIAVLGILAIVGASALGSKLGVAAPLLLVVAGIAVSLLPFVPEIEIEPEWILAGVLPPLLYSASVSMPTMDFRREFSAISGLSIALVVISAVLLGLFFAWLIPGLGLWWGIALGAIVSPTDAVATSIVKKVGVSPRVVSILEGESLLNDATALVLLRTAIAGAAASVSLWGALGDFAFAVLVAVAIGAVVGWGNLRLRSRVSDVTVNTVLSFTVPFLASIPAELLGASGLVAAVTAGLITGHGAPRRLSPQARLSDKQNWKSIELVLEGAVFLTMGLEMAKILTDVNDDHAGVGPAVAIAAGALVLTVLIRAGFVAPLLVLLHRRARRGEAMKDRIESIQDKLADPEAFAESVRARTEELRAGREQGELRERRGGPNATFEDRIARSGGFGAPLAERVEHWQTRFRRASADIDYLLASPLGWREGTVVVWAGMRGAVTVAAAQTLPQGTPNRSLLILIAFLVAAGSLLIQGGTIKRIVAWLKPRQGDDGDQAEERRRIMELLAEAGASVHEEKWEGVPTKKMLLEVIAAQRGALLDARDDGLFTSEVLSSALAVLDADQIRIELRGGPEG